MPNTSTYSFAIFLLSFLYRRDCTWGHGHSVGKMLFALSSQRNKKRREYIGIESWIFHVHTHFNFYWMMALIRFFSLFHQRNQAHIFSKGVHKWLLLIMMTFLHSSLCDKHGTVLQEFSPVRTRICLSNQAGKSMGHGANGDPAILLSLIVQIMGWFMTTILLCFLNLKSFIH